MKRGLAVAFLAGAMSASLVWYAGTIGVRNEARATLHSAAQLETKANARLWQEVQQLRVENARLQSAPVYLSGAAYRGSRSTAVCVELDPGEQLGLGNERHPAWYRLSLQDEPCTIQSYPSGWEGMVRPRAPQEVQP